MFFANPTFFLDNNSISKYGTPHNVPDPDLVPGNKEELLHPVEQLENKEAHDKPCSGTKTSSHRKQLFTGGNSSEYFCISPDWWMHAAFSKDCIQINVFAIEGRTKGWLCTGNLLGKRDVIFKGLLYDSPTISPCDSFFPPQNSWVDL